MVACENLRNFVVSFLSWLKKLTYKVTLNHERKQMTSKIRWKKKTELGMSHYNSRTVSSFYGLIEPLPPPNGAKVEPVAKNGRDVVQVPPNPKISNTDGLNPVFTESLQQQPVKDRNYLEPKSRNILWTPVRCWRSSSKVIRSAVRLHNTEELKLSRRAKKLN